jgi:hypothetical protein
MIGYDTSQEGVTNLQMNVSLLLNFPDDIAQNYLSACPYYFDTYMFCVFT